MDDYDGSVMVALLPVTTDWCRIECPHLTLVYAGKTSDLEPGDYNELAKEAASIAMLSRPLNLRVSGLDVFGDEPDEKVDVLRFQYSSELMAMREMLESWNASEYTEYKPHATIGPIGTSMFLKYVPEYVIFDRIMVGWGDDYLTFWLKMAGM